MTDPNKTLANAERALTEHDRRRAAARVYDSPVPPVVGALRDLLPLARAGARALDREVLFDALTNPDTAIGPNSDRDPDLTYYEDEAYAIADALIAAFTAPDTTSEPEWRDPERYVSPDGHSSRDSVQWAGWLEKPRTRAEYDADQEKNR